MAEAAVNILVSDGHENQVYDFVNTEVYGHDDVAMYISEITGKNIISQFKLTLSVTKVRLYKERQRTGRCRSLF